VLLVVGKVGCGVGVERVYCRTFQSDQHRRSVEYRSQSVPEDLAMNIPPLVDRELRVIARLRSFLWLGGLLAVAVGFQAYDLLNNSIVAPATSLSGPVGFRAGLSISGPILLRAMAGLMFVSALLLGLFCADSINAERRQGTLGLLFLTNLKPAQIIYGKMLSYGLTSFLVLLGALPALVIPVLAGGVRGVEAFVSSLGVLNALFVSLAAGLWMSAYFRERRYAIAATLGLVAALGFGADIIGGSMFGPDARPFCRLLGLGGWMTTATLPTALIPISVFWFAPAHALGWFFLHRAAVSLAANWRDEPGSSLRQVEPANPWASAPPRSSSGTKLETQLQPEPVVASASWLTDPRPWDADPIRWRVEQVGVLQGQIWLAVLISLLAQFGVLGSIFYNPSALASSWGLLSFAGTAVLLGSSGLMAAPGARFFHQARHNHELELLLTTPVGYQNIVSGQWRLLRRALAAPVSVVVTLASPAGIAAAVDLSRGFTSDAWFLLPPVLIALNVVLDALALCWAGMCFGQRTPNLLSAVVQTVVLVQLVPLCLASIAIASWAWLTNHTLGPTISHNRMPVVIPVLLGFLVKNLALIFWSRYQLSGDLRLRRLAPQHQGFLTRTWLFYKRTEPN